MSLVMANVGCLFSWHQLGVRLNPILTLPEVSFGRPSLLQEPVSSRWSQATCTLLSHLTTNFRVPTTASSGLIIWCNDSQNQRKLFTITVLFCFFLNKRCSWGTTWKRCIGQGGEGLQFPWSLWACYPPSLSMSCSSTRKHIKFKSFYRVQSLALRPQGWWVGWQVLTLKSSNWPFWLKSLWGYLAAPLKSPHSRTNSGVVQSGSPGMTKILLALCKLQVFLGSSVPRTGTKTNTYLLYYNAKITK